MLWGECWVVLHYSTLQLHCWTAPLGQLLTLLFPLLGKADITHPKQNTNDTTIITFILGVISEFRAWDDPRYVRASFQSAAFSGKASSRWEPRWHPLRMKYQCEWLTPKFGVNHHHKCQTHYHQIFARSCFVHLVAGAAGFLREGEDFHNSIQGFWRSLLSLRVRGTRFSFIYLTNDLVNIPFSILGCTHLILSLVRVWVKEVKLVFNLIKMDRVCVQCSSDANVNKHTVFILPANHF